MSDTTVTTEAPMPNSPEARTPTGELKDQSASTQTQTSTTESTETKPESTTTSKESTTTETGAPEKYADFTLPEGVKLDDTSLKSAQDLFKAQNLSQTQAQALVDFHVAQLKATTDASSKSYEDMRTDWQAKTKADPEIGFKLPAVKETVGRALATLNDPSLVAEFRAAMDLTGIGDHPAFIKAFYKLSQSVVEGKHVTGTQPSKFGQQAPGTNERPTAAHALYPNNP